MQPYLYHLRRVCLSHLLEFVLQINIWRQQLQGVFLPLYLFIVGAYISGVIGIVNTEWLLKLMGYPDNMGSSAVWDARSLYGTMFLGVACALTIATFKTVWSQIGLLFVAGMLLGLGVSNLGAVLFEKDIGWLSAHGISFMMTFVLGLWAIKAFFDDRQKGLQVSACLSTFKMPSPDPQTPQEINPLLADSMQNPFLFYRLLREQAPLYRPIGADFYCVSRYDDVMHVLKETDVFSSITIQVQLDKQFKGHADANSVRFAGQSSRNWGIFAVEALVTQDPPAHTYQRKAVQKFATIDRVRGFEPEFQTIVDQVLTPFINNGGGDFQELAWHITILATLRLVGLPDSDYEAVKDGAWKTLTALANELDPIQFNISTIGNLRFMRLIWKRFLEHTQNPKEANHFAAMLIRSLKDQDSDLTTEEAVTLLFQFMIGGSDSSASTMGNAIKMLIEHPELESLMRAQPDRIPDFIEEVIRLESPFQGVFRITKQDTQLCDTPLPKGTRVFAILASANRDPNVFVNPDVIDIDRPSLKRHKAFGHDIHACFGRELARLEVRVVLQTLLARTERIEIVGPTPYLASLFNRSLVQLPLAVTAQK